MNPKRCLHKQTKNPTIPSHRSLTHLPMFDSTEYLHSSNENQNENLPQREQILAMHARKQQLNIERFSSSRRSVLYTGAVVSPRSSDYLKKIDRSDLPAPAIVQPSRERSRPRYSFIDHRVQGNKPPTELRLVSFLP